MARERILRWLFYLNVGVVVALVGYRVYLNVFEQDFVGLHARQVERIQRALADAGRYTFAVVGNVNNSVGLFEQKIIPLLNASGAEFVVSAGNSVSGGGEDKYRALQGTLEHLRVPYLLTFAQHEYESFGSYRFYEHFGPYLYDFVAGDTHFLFLDSTGKTAVDWQLRWLRDRLQSTDAAHTFMFVGSPVRQADVDLLFDTTDNYLQPRAFRDALIATAREHDVDAVFSANLPIYDRQVVGGTDFVTTGGAGGLILNNEASFYHYVEVAVDSAGVEITPVRLDIGRHPVLKTLESLWFFVHSLFYVGYLNFLLLLSALSIVAIWLYQLIFTDRDYYPTYDVDPTPFQGRSLRVATFTNNYLPFVGGVPLSIERLRKGLRSLGHEVLVVAPSYEDHWDETGTLRVPSLLAMGVHGEFRVANIFLRRIRKAVMAFAPDVVHLHHPFWLGSLGLFLARRLRVPAVYTYHTRLEHYAHYVPLPSILFRNLISHYLVKRFANRCDGVIVPTQSTEEYLRLIGVKSSIFVQPTGVNYRPLSEVDRDAVAALRTRLGIGEERVFISVSRLSREKNVDFMIDAIASLRERTDEAFRFLMIGDGEARERLQAKIDKLGLSDVFQLIGQVAPEDIPLYYALGDAFLFASKSETQGMVILEAMAAGLPVVAVRSSGIDDVIQEGVNGFKTPENLDEWAERVRRLLTDDQRRQAMARDAQAFAGGFHVDAVAGRIVGFYAQVMAERAKRGNTGGS